MCPGRPSSLNHRLQTWDDLEEEFERWCSKGSSGSFDFRTLDWKIANDELEDEKESDVYQAESSKERHIFINRVDSTYGEGQTQASKDELFKFANLVPSPKKENPTGHGTEDASTDEPNQPEVPAKLQSLILPALPMAHITAEPVTNPRISNLHSPKEIHSHSKRNKMNPISSIMYLTHELETIGIANNHKSREITESNLMNFNKSPCVRSHIDQFCTISEATNALEALNVHLMAVLAVTKLKRNDRTG